MGNSAENGTPPNKEDRTPSSRFAKLYAKYEGDRVFGHEILKIMVRDIPPLLESLDAALLRKDAELVIKKAHSLSNISGTVLEMEIHRFARSMEKSARQGDLTGAADLYASVKPLVRKLCDAAKKEIDTDL
jgi:two-component system sensor histidine kinase BarA